MSEDLNQLAFDSATLDQCLKHLHRPDINRNPPRECYQKLSFSNGKSKHINLSSGEFNQMIKNKYPKVYISPYKIKAYTNGKIWVHNDLKSDLKSKRKKRYTLVSIEYQNSSKDRFGLIHDRHMSDWELFRYPSTRYHDEKIIYPMEKKIHQLISQKLRKNYMILKKLVLKEYILTLWMVILFQI